MRKLILCCLAAALPLAAYPNGYDVPNVSPRDLALVGSAVADQVDAGATYGCPAALARASLAGLSLNLGGTLLDIRTTWTATTTALEASSPTETSFHPAYPVALYASYGTSIADHRVGFGVGMTVPAGGNVFWPSNWAGRSFIITVDRRIYGFYGSVGVEIIPQVRLGGGFIYYRATEDLLQGLDPTSGTVELAAAGGMASWDASLEVEPLLGVPLVLAVDYKQQAYIKLSGTAHFVVPPTLQAQLQDQNVSHVLPYPNVLQFGVSYDPIPQLRLTGTYSFDRYVIYSQDVFVGDKPLPGPIVVPRDYSNGSVYRIGAQWQAIPQLALRAGVLRDVSGLPKQTVNGQLVSSTYSPTLPDSNSWAFGFGAGYSLAENLTVNGAIFYAHMDEVTAPSGSSLIFPGTYDTHVLIYSIGLTYNWAPGESPGHLRSF